MSDGYYLMRLTEPGHPKRGDLMQTAVGTKRERTWFIWFSRRALKVPHGFQILRVRWWEIEPHVRLMLHKSAERQGGQTVWFQNPNPKPRRSIQEIL